MKTVQFKTLYTILNAVLAAFFVVTLYFILHFISFPFTNNNPAVNYLLLIGAFFGSFYLSAYFTKSDAEIEITDNQLVIRLHNEWLNRTHEKIFTLSELLAFEMMGSRQYSFLVLYKNKKSPCVISIANGGYEKEITELLEPVLKLISKKQPLSNKSFADTYFTAVKNLFQTLFISLGLFAAALWIEYDFHETFEINYAYKWGWLVIFIGSIFLYNYRHNACNFRTGPKYFTFYILTLFYCYMIFFVPYGLLKAIKTPVEVNSIKEVDHFPNQLFFDIKQVDTDTSLIGSYYWTESGKSTFVKYNHYLVIPALADSNLLSFSFWIANSYSQKLSNSYSKSKKQEVFRAKARSFYQSFKAFASSQPKFYELIHSEAGKLVKEKNYRKAVTSTGHSHSPKIFILHRENFDDFKKAEIRKIMLISVVFVSIFLLLPLAVAFHR